MQLANSTVATWTSRIRLSNSLLGALMKSKDTPKADKLNMDLLDRLIERENPDEMGLLDLIFIEEILNQRAMDATV